MATANYTSWPENNARASAAQVAQTFRFKQSWRWYKAYIDGEPLAVAGATLGGFRTVLTVPMLKENELVGAIVVLRQEVRPFSDKQIALVQNFAAQAVIAIENTRLLNELRQRTTDLTESLEQQTATSEVLSVISRSPGELEPVFQAMLANATRLCQAQYGGLFLSSADGLRNVATHGGSSPLFERLKQAPVVALSEHPHLPLAQAARTKKVVHITDVYAEPSYTERDPIMVRLVDAAGARTLLVVPMLKEDDLVGAIAVYRQEAQPFTDKQIALVQNFAAQAVIAIENTRLLNELRQRTDDLTESLEQQTATSEVLRVISSSPGDLQPVFQAMLENAVRICDAKFGNIYRWEGDALHLVASHNTPPAFVQARRRSPFHRDDAREPVISRLLATKTAVHIADAAAMPGYLDRSDQRAVAGVELGGVRTVLAVPMLLENEVIGSFTVYRQEVRPFTDKQIALVQNFAAQAVIAIENTRLLNELRESLEQQTATSEVLGVISSSPGELEPVFQAMLENATRICEAKFGNMALSEGNNFRIVAVHHPPHTHAEWWSRGAPIVMGDNPNIPLVRMIETKAVVHVADLREERAYIEGNTRIVALVEGGIRTFLIVPMLKDDVLIGTITIYRQEVRPFTDKQIALMQNFAAQAVIAIENTRLLNELRQRTDDLSESLEQQTAISEILRVISNSPSDVQPVLESVAERAAQICEAQYVDVFLLEGSALRDAACFGEIARVPTLPLDRSVVAGRSVVDLAPVHVADLLNAGDEFAAGREYARQLGHRTILCVPLIREGRALGTIMVRRTEVRPFEQKHIALLTTFADQAAIAIENARLLNELRQSLQQQTATADVLKVISRSTFDLQAVLNTLIESATRLCEADMGSINRQSGDAYRQVANYGHSPELQAYMDRHPIPAGHGSVVGRTVMAGGIIHIPDVFADPDYKMAESARIGGIHTMLGVPLLREGTPIGVIVLQRKAVRPFTEKQIELVTTFADQAVIAIENVRLFDEIQDKSRQLEVASQHKSQFLANMSHELRTPLNAILGYTELMADGIYGQLPEKTMGVLKRLESNGRHLLGLINDVLDLSKIEAGQLVLDLSDYSLEDIAQTVRSTLEPLAADKKLAFKVEVAPKLPAGHGDGRRLTQVLINLVGNAIKFTDAGEVAIKAAIENGSFQVAVHDTGPGIAPTDQAKLFQEFQQADNSITRKKGGTGLGLAISKRIIEMHGGRIWIDSAVGQGSTFTFTLPVRVERQVEPA